MQITPNTHHEYLPHKSVKAHCSAVAIPFKLKELLVQANSTVTLNLSHCHAAKKGHNFIASVISIPLCQCKVALPLQALCAKSENCRQDCWISHCLCSSLFTHIFISCLFLRGDHLLCLIAQWLNKLKTWLIPPSTSAPTRKSKQLHAITAQPNSSPGIESPRASHWNIQMAIQRTSSYSMYSSVKKCVVHGCKTFCGASKKLTDSICLLQSSPSTSSALPAASCDCTGQSLAHLWNLN